MNVKRQYYCLIAGLPDIAMSENKLTLTLAELRDILKTELHTVDYQLVENLFRLIDHQNILQAIYHLPGAFNANGNLTVEEISNLIDKTQFDEQLPVNIPSYLGNTVREALLQDSLISPAELNTLLLNRYITHFESVANPFLSAYATFDNNIRNFFIALNGRQYQIDVEYQLIGNSDIVEALRKNRSRDFGLSMAFEQLESYLQLFDLDDITIREFKLDTMRWHFVDDATLFNYFTIERILAYLIQCQIKERWQKLDAIEGRERFSHHIENILLNCEYPKQFNISYGRKS